MSHDVSSLRLSPLSHGRPQILKLSSRPLEQENRDIICFPALIMHRQHMMIEHGRFLRCTNAPKSEDGGCVNSYIIIGTSMYQLLGILS